MTRASLHDDSVGPTNEAPPISASRPGKLDDAAVPATTGGIVELGGPNTMSAQDMLETYGERLTKFQTKLLNAFARRLFGTT